MESHRATGNTSQQHGNEFQYLMMAARAFSGAFNVARTGQEEFDIEGRCDRLFGLATSVKTASGDWIGLADAERFCRIDRPWRMLFSQWTQPTPTRKRYDVIHELIIPLGVMKTIVGEVTPALALKWHMEIASYPEGKINADLARKRADEIKAEWKGRTGHLRLDFKIDDKKQRRLQFSIQFSVLTELLRGLGDYRGRGRSQPHHVVHEGEFHQYPLPITLISPPRRIDKDASPPAVEAILFDPGVELAPTAQTTADDDVFAGAAPSLRRAPPIRREERERKRRETAQTRQITLFG